MHDRDDVADALHGLANDLPAREANAPKHGDRLCPICAKLMLVENLHGVEIDTCPDHGIWLDHDELRSVMATPRSTGAARRHTLDQIKRAKRDGKVAGALLGVWSLLLPD